MTAVAPTGDAVKKPGPVTDSVQYLELGVILPNPNQPRKHFDEEALAGLASSIRKEGVIQPIIVTQVLTEDLARIAIPADKLPEGKTHADYVGKHLIIAGQRRWMASGLANKKVIPAIVRSLEVADGKVKDDALTVLSATENLTRTDMTVYEEAMVYKYHESQGWTHAVIATQYGKHRTHVANMLGLLDLPKPVVEALANPDSGVTMGHARWLKSLKDHPDLVLALFKRITDDGVSVRWIEEQVKEAQARLKAAEPKEKVEQEINDAPKTQAGTAGAAPTAGGEPAPGTTTTVTQTTPPAEAQNVIVSDEIVAAVKQAKNALKTGVKYIPGDPEGRLEIQIFGMADLARILKVLGVAAEVADAVNK